MKIYVGGLLNAVTDQQLRRAFAVFGTVASAEVMKAHLSGAPRGFGFVDMPVCREAVAAIAALDGCTSLGGALEVSEVRRPDPRTTRDRRAARALLKRNRNKTKPAITSGKAE
ncbi:MAG: RNA-binding protein [Candidatus Zixiibacteriota bacterium]